jgi:alpha-amylase
LSLNKIEQTAPFYFYIDIGDYTGVNASSYEDFLASIKKVNARSLIFHLKRGDFEKWVFDVLKDEKLAKEIGELRNRKISGLTLRNRLYSIVSKRHEELTSKTR